MADVRFPADHRRLSDVLNGETHTYLPIFNAQPRSAPDWGDAQTVVLTDAISWVEARTEPEYQGDQRGGRFHTVVIDLKGPAVTVRGELFVGADSSVYQTLTNGNRFICLRNAKFLETGEETPFLAVSTRQWA